MKFNTSRDMFFEEVGKRMEAEDIYVVSADLAGRPFDGIRERFPERFVQVGKAEQNMVSTAVGLASLGAKVIAYTAAPFHVLRAFDQIRNGAAMMRFPLAIAGVGTGFSIAEYGTTHFSTEDVALMSLCPGIRQVTVSDEAVAESALERFLEQREMLYLRLDKLCCGCLPFPKPDIDVGFRVRNGGPDTLLITQGYTSQAVNEIDWGGGPVPVWADVFSVPFDEERMLDMIGQAKRVVVCEEQQKRGGLGTMLLELLNEHGMNRQIICMGVDYGQAFPEVYGSRRYWLKQYRIDGEAIKDAVINGGKGQE